MSKLQQFKVQKKADLNALITVIIPVYNCEKYIAKTIESVCAQTYANLEILVVDDCATDNTRLVVQKYAERDKRIQLICNEKNIGVAEARNVGIQYAKGDYIALLDGDDIWLPQKIENQLRLLQETDADLAYCSYDFIDKNDKTIGRPFLVPQKTNFYQMLSKSVIGCSTCLVLTKFLQEHKFSTEFYHEDYVLWLELLQHGCKAVGNEQVLVHYRRMLGTRSNNKLTAAKMRWKIYRHFLNFSYFKSAYYFARYAWAGFIKYM